MNQRSRNQRSRNQRSKRSNRKVRPRNQRSHRKRRSIQYKKRAKNYKKTHRYKKSRRKTGGAPWNQRRQEKKTGKRQAMVSEYQKKFATEVPEIIQMVKEKLKGDAADQFELALANSPTRYDVAEDGIPTVDKMNEALEKMQSSPSRSISAIVFGEEIYIKQAGLCLKYLIDIKDQLNRLKKMSLQPVPGDGGEQALPGRFDFKYKVIAAYLLLDDFTVRPGETLSKLKMYKNASSYWNTYDLKSIVELKNILHSKDYEVRNWSGMGDKSDAVATSHHQADHNKATRLWNFVTAKKKRDERVKRAESKKKLEDDSVRAGASLATRTGMDHALKTPQPPSWGFDSNSRSLGDTWLNEHESGAFSTAAALTVPTPAHAVVEEDDEFEPTLTAEERQRLEDEAAQYRMLTAGEENAGNLTDTDTNKKPWSRRRSNTNKKPGQRRRSNIFGRAAAQDRFSGVPASDKASFIARGDGDLIQGSDSAR